MTIKAHEFEHIVNKLGLKTRNAGDRLAWLEYAGKVIACTRRSHRKGGDLPFQNSIRQQLKLNEAEFRQAVGCSLSREDYIAILRRKGLLPPPAPAG